MCVIIELAKTDNLELSEDFLELTTIDILVLFKFRHSGAGIFLYCP